MYKNISFQEAEFGEKKFLMYRVDDASQMDHVEVEMLKNNDIKGLLPFSSAQNNDETIPVFRRTCSLGGVISGGTGNRCGNNGLRAVYA